MIGTGSSSQTLGGQATPSSRMAGTLSSRRMTPTSANDLELPSKEISKEAGDFIQVHGIGHLPVRGDAAKDTSQLNVITDSPPRPHGFGAMLGHTIGHTVGGGGAGLAPPPRHGIPGGTVNMDYRWAKAGPSHNLPERGGKAPHVLKSGFMGGGSNMHKMAQSNALRSPNRTGGLNDFDSAQGGMYAGLRPKNEDGKPKTPPMLMGGGGSEIHKKISDNMLVLRMVGKYLTIADACRGSCVNKKFQNLSRCMESVDLSPHAQSFRSFQLIGRILHLRALLLKGLNLNPIKDLHEVTKCRNLQRIDFSEARLNTSLLTALQGCTRLAYINLQESDIEDIKPLGRILSLTKVILRDTIVSNVAPLGHCTNLMYLDLHHTKVSDLSALSSCKKLQHLDLRQCENLREKTDFSAFKNLKNLNLFGTKVSDISSLQTCYKLTVLNLWFTPVKSIWPITTCVSLLHLDLSNTKVDSLVPLAGCNKLRHLSLWSTPITDIEVLRQLTNLKRLDLTETRLTSISPLKACGKLTSLHLWATPVTSIRALKHCVQI